MIDIISWAGSICFALCGIPQAWQSYRQGHSNGLSWPFLILWFMGELFTIIYVAVEVRSLPLLVNYGCNFLCLVVVIRYRVRPRVNETAVIAHRIYKSWADLYNAHANRQAVGPKKGQT